MLPQKFYEFNATIMSTNSASNNYYCYIELPFKNLQSEFGQTEMIPIDITFDNITHTRGIINNNSTPHFIINSKIKVQLQKEIGDLVHINLHYDNKPPEIKIPKSLLKTIWNHDLINQWEELSTINKKEFIKLWKHNGKKHQLAPIKAIFTTLTINNDDRIGE